MKPALREFILMIVSALCVAVPAGAVCYINRAIADRYEEMATHYQERANYFFKGANERHLLDFCTDEKGEVVVLYKEDCPHPL